MNKAVPWSIKGVDFDAREAAKEAARRSGLTLGEWLNSVIAEQAAEMGVEVDDVDEVDRLEAVASRLARMSRGGHAPPARSRRQEEEPMRPSRARQARPRAYEDDRDYGRDYERSRARPARDFDPEDLLDGAIQSFERNSRQHAQRTTAALSRVVERLEDIEEKLEVRKPIGRGDARATLAKIQDRLDDLGPREVPPAPQPAPAPVVAPAASEGFARLEAKLTTLIETLVEQREAPAPVYQPAPVYEPAPVAVRAPAPAPAPRMTPPVPRVGRATIPDAIAQITRRQRELDARQGPRRTPAKSHVDLWAPLPPDAAQLHNSTAIPPAAHASMAAPAAAPAPAPGPDFSVLHKEIAALSARLEDTRREIIERDERRHAAAVERARAMPAPASDPGPEVAMLRRQIEDLSKGFAQLASRENLSSLEVAVRDLSQRVEASRQGGIGENILRPVEQLASDIRRSLADLPAASAFQVIESEIRSLRSRLDEMQSSSFDPRSFGELQTQTAEIRAMLSQALAQPVSLDSVERKIAGLTDRVDLLARHGSNPIDSAAVIQSIGDIRGTLDAALGNGILAQLAGRMDALAQRLEAVALAPPAVDRLSERIDVLGRKIEDAVSQSNTTDHFDRLSQRLETVQRSLDGRPELTPPNFDTSALESMMRELAEKLERPSQASSSGDMRSVTALQTDITRLADQLERVAPAIDTSRIEDMVQHLSEKLERVGAPASDLALAEALSQQIALLSSRVDQTAHLPDRSIADELREEMSSLARRIEAGQASVDTHVLEEVRHQISLLSERLQVGDESARVLASLETAVGDLFSRIDDMRDATLGAAESAARVAAREAVREVLDVQPVAPGAPGEAISRELLDLRSMQDAADRRTHSTLTAVHETLEKIVDRLAMLEEDFAEVTPTPLPGGARPAARAEVADEPLLASGPAPSFVRTKGAQEAPAVAVRAPETRARGEAAAPSIDDLMEPGSGVPLSRRGNEPAAAPDVAPEQDSSRQASFIAAARRAAQSAMGGKKDKKAEKSARVADAAKVEPKLDPMFDARERAKAAHLAALSEAGAAPVRKTAEGGSALGRVQGFIQSHRRAVFAGLACIATILGTLQAIRLLQPQEPSQTVVEYSVPATPSPQSSPTQDAPAGALDEQRHGALEAPAASKVAGNFSQGPMDLSQSQRFVAAGPASQQTDPSVTNSISPVAPVGRLSLNAAAIAGQANAQFELASRFADGRGVTRDLQQARQWFEKAAAQNIAPAQFRLGAIYERGTGVERNLQKAHDLYLRAANQGHVRAMHNLAVLSAEGVDGKPDYATAASWFQKAAEYGIRDSQYNLAILMARGLGVEQNLKQSWMWFALAAAQGDTDAEKKRDEVGARLGVKDVAAARIQFEAFRNKVPISAANDVAGPPGGWDQAAPARPETKVEAPAAKPARGKVTSL